MTSSTSPKDRWQNWYQKAAFVDGTRIARAAFDNFYRLLDRRLCAHCKGYGVRVAIMARFKQLVLQILIPFLKVYITCNL